MFFIAPFLYTFKQERVKLSKDNSTLNKTCFKKNVVYRRNIENVKKRGGKMLNPL